VVDHEALPWCNASEDAQDQDSCPFAKDILRQSREESNEESSGVDTEFCR
jgi:hypothetical protein